jgi:hypothetical protein
VHLYCSRSASHKVRSIIQLQTALFESPWYVDSVPSLRSFTEAVIVQAQTPEQAPLSVATEVCSDMFPSEHEDETIASIASLQSPPNSTRAVSSIPATHTSTPTTTPADHTNALTEFELFPNFPMELRLKIVCSAYLCILISLILHVR